MSTSAQASRSTVWLAHALVTAATLVTFARAVPYPLQLHWDDERFIAKNPFAHEISLTSLRAIVSGPHFEAYHPLHLLSYWLDVPLAGAHGPVLHATSLALYALAASAVLALFMRLGLPLVPAALGTLACVLHPVQVEAVSWATGRKDVLALLFTALAFRSHLRAERAWDRHALGSALFYALGVLSKTTVLPLPLVIALGDSLLGRRRPFRALGFQGPKLLLAGLGSAVVLSIWQRASMIRDSLAPMPARVIESFAHHLTTLLWPSELSPMYSTDLPSAPSASAVLLLIGYAAACAIALRSKQRLLALGLCAFPIWLLPVLNVVPMYFPLQDRYASLPSLAFGLVLGAIAMELAETVRARALVTAPVLALAIVSIGYQGKWRDEPTLWGHAASTQPAAYYAWIKLAEVRRDAGALEGAARAYRTAIEQRPERKLAHAGLLWVLCAMDERAMRAQGAPTRAPLGQLYAERFYSALDDAAALRQLSSQMASTGHVRALELPLARSLELAPVPDQALERAAIAALAEGRIGLARVYVAAMKRAPSDAQLRKLAP